MTVALYRFLDADCRLLYIGISNNPHRRLDEHAAEKPWWPSVELVRIRHYATREQALEAERAAIRSECPIYNGTHNTDPYRQRPERPPRQQAQSDSDWLADVKTAIGQAADWLTDYLDAHGPRVRSADAMAAGRRAGHSDTAIKRARRQLKLEVVNEGFPRTTYWTEPSSKEDSEYPLTCQARISEYLAAAGAPVAPDEIFSAVDGPLNNMRASLGQLVRKGYVKRIWDESKKPRYSHVRPYGQTCTNCSQVIDPKLQPCALPDGSPVCTQCAAAEAEGVLI